MSNHSIINRPHTRPLSIRPRSKHKLLHIPHQPVKRMNPLHPTPIPMQKLPLNSRMPPISSTVQIKPPILSSPISKPRLISNMHSNNVSRRSQSPTIPNNARSIRRINSPHSPRPPSRHSLPPIRNHRRQVLRPTNPLKPSRRVRRGRDSLVRDVGSRVADSVGLGHGQQHGAHRRADDQVDSGERHRYPPRAERPNAHHQFHLYNPPTRVY
jgi:hypothetical protein